MAKRVAIVQSNYVPWRGYFDLIDRVDEFVLYDDRQYTRRDWRNRNRIKTAAGVRWITIPVQSKGRYEQRIDETVVADPAWRRSHLDAILRAYAAAPFARELRPWLEELYLGADDRRLSVVNRRFLEAVCRLVGIETPLSWSTDYEAGGGRTDRLVGLCKAAGATTYVSGPAARDYLDEERFEREGIAVEWMDYAGYPEYPQLHGAFVPDVSILDVLLCVGPAEARAAIGGAADVAS
jgi:WbqC-like protein family